MACFSSQKKDATRPSCARRLSCMWRCLRIEGDQENSRYIKAAFQAQNYEVTVAYDGPTGLELAQADNWDLIILDRMLPNSLDGLSILSTLREKGQQT